jgi:tRNA dimethylallyltransferase
VQPRLIAVTGETASGKSSLAERLADETSALLVNADAFQVYRGFDIGTSKPSDKSRYALLDLKNPEEDFGVGEWIRLALPLLEEAFGEQRDVVLVGGTGFYIRALLEGWSDMHDAPDPKLRADLEARLGTEGIAPLLEELQKLDPSAAARVDPKNPVRVRRALEKALTPSEPFHFKLPDFQMKKVRIEWPTEELDARIAKRLTEMLDAGWIAEVEALLAQGVPLECPGFRAIGYISIAKFLQGEISEEDLITEIVLKTRQYAKRQRTWLRSEKNLQTLSCVDFLRTETIGNLLSY